MFLCLPHQCKRSFRLACGGRAPPAQAFVSYLFDENNRGTRSIHRAQRRSAKSWSEPADGSAQPNPIDVTRFTRVTTPPSPQPLSRRGERGKQVNGPIFHLS